MKTTLTLLLPGDWGSSEHNQCCIRAVLNLQEFGSPLWPQSLCCCGQRCGNVQVGASHQQTPLAVWWRGAQHLKAVTDAEPLSSAATPKPHPTWCACSQGNFALRPADVLVPHALQCCPTFIPSLSPGIALPVSSSVLSCWWGSREDFVPKSSL